MPITKPQEVIEHIIHKEVQEGTGEIPIDYGDSEDINVDIDLAFTVHGKQINSKKLIENIARNSKLIPYIKNDTLFFKGINPSPSPELTTTTLPDNTVGDVDIYIESSDIISYTNKRTSPEKVYTKVVVNYHYDYGLEEYIENTLEDNEGSDTATEYFDISANQHETGALYSNSYYGLTKEQELSFDADYIRDIVSAEALQEFLLLWHCNQHNVLKLRLPLKYIQLEIGDYIGFDKLINGVKLFGEDYSIEYYTLNEQSPATNVFRNGQQILPVWMITSTNKTLTHIDVEMIQMHNCSDTVIDALKYAPLIESAVLELIHPVAQGNVVHHKIILSESDTWFQIKLTNNARAPNDDELFYLFQHASVLNHNTLGIADDLVEGSDSQDLWDDLEIDNGMVNNIQYSENNITLELGDSPNGGEHGEWLTNWIADADGGEYLEFPNNNPASAFLETVVTDGVFSTHKRFPTFRVYKDFIPGIEVTVDISYVSGWNLIGLPCEVGDPYYPTLFPDAVPGTLYGFDGNYEQMRDLEIGKGYYLYFNNAGMENISGTLVEPYGDGTGEYEIELTDGWNLISGLHYPIDVTDIVDPEGIIVPNTLYGFIDGEYTHVDVLEVGQAYWIRASQDGTIGLRVYPN